MKSVKPKKVLTSLLRGTDSIYMLRNHPTFISNQSQHTVTTSDPYFIIFVNLDVRYASRHNLNFPGAASDWFTGWSSQLGGRETSFPSFQTVEESNSYSGLKSLKVGGGRCNLGKQGISCKSIESKEHKGTNRMSEKVLLLTPKRASRTV